MRHRWLGDQATRRLKAKLHGNVDQAGADYQAAVVDAIATIGPPRSAPGEAPHVDTDRYHTSWSHETDEGDDVIASRISTDTPYSVYLEDGTDRMEPRPHIKPTLIADADKLGRTMCKP